MNKKTALSTWLMFLLVVVIAGSNFVAVKFSNQELPPFWGAGLRFFAASVLFLLYLVLKKIPLPRGKALAGAVLYGTVGIGASYALLYWSLLKVPAGIASVIIALVPLLTYLLALLHKLEKFRVKAVAGALIAASGIALIFFEQASSAVEILPLLALIAGAVCIAETGIIVKLYPKVNPAVMNAVGMFSGSILLFVFSLVNGETMLFPTQPETLTAFLYLVGIGSIGLFTLILLILKRWTASAVSYQLVLAPIVTTVLAAALMGEPITLTFIIGGLIVFMGVYLGALSV